MRVLINIASVAVTRDLNLQVMSSFGESRLQCESRPDTAPITDIYRHTWKRTFVIFKRNSDEHHRFHPVRDREHQQQTSVKRPDYLILQTFAAETQSIM
jgi:hypothetical protein